MGGFRAPTAVGGFRARSSRLAATRPRTPPRRVAISNRIVRLRSAATLNPRSLAPSFPTRTLTATLSIGSLPFCFECRLVPAACQLSSSALATSVHSSPPSASNFAHRHSSSLLHPRPSRPTFLPSLPTPSALALALALALPFSPFSRPPNRLSLSLSPNQPWTLPLPLPSPLCLQSPQDPRPTPPLPPDGPNRHHPCPLRSQINAFIACPSPWARAPGRISGPSVLPSPEPVNEQSYPFADHRLSRPQRHTVSPFLIRIANQRPQILPSSWFSPPLIKRGHPLAKSPQPSATPCIPPSSFGSSCISLCLVALAPTNPPLSPAIPSPPAQFGALPKLARFFLLRQR